MGRIYIVIGKSATGKDTVYKKLLESKELNLKTVVMYTTRPIRKGEKDGIEYYFVSQEKLQELMAQNKIIEHRVYQTVHGPWHYFTVNDGQIDLEQSDYMMIGTLEAYGQIREYFGEDKVIPIYIEVDDGTRLHRALSREQRQEEPKYAEMCRRFLADEKDFSEDNIDRLGIVKKYQNVDLQECLSQIKNDIKNFTVNSKSDMI